MDDDDGIVETVSDNIVLNKPSSTGSVISILTSIIYSRKFLDFLLVSHF
jgi:hypothetical protein